MVKTSTLSRKLASYSVLATAVLATEKSGAQIVYTSLSPNVVLTTPLHVAGDTSYYLDLNNDGVSDFRFFAEKNVSNFTANNYSRYYYDGMQPLTGNNAGDHSAGYIYGNTIGSKIKWSGGPQTFAIEQIMTNTGSQRIRVFSGNLLGKSNVYMPLELLNKGKTFYGWARLTVRNADTLVLIDYAYNLVPDDTILAGQTGCGKNTPVTPVVTQSGDTLKSSTAKSYQWYFADSLLVNDTSKFLTPTDTGYYSVITTDSNGCLSQSLALHDDTVSQTTTDIPTATLTDEAYIYSYNKILHVLLYDKRLLGSNVRIYNTAGQEIFTTLITTSQTDIDLKEFAAGLYIVEIGGKQPVVTRKISIE